MNMNINKMIIEIELHKCSASIPPFYSLYYKNEDEICFRVIRLDKYTLVNFLEMYGYETNDIERLIMFGVNTENIKCNKNL